MPDRLLSFDRVNQAALKRISERTGKFKTARGRELCLACVYVQLASAETFETAVLKALKELPEANEPDWENYSNVIGRLLQTLGIVLVWQCPPRSTDMRS